MSDYVKGVKVGDVAKQIDYNSLANLPELVSVDDTLTQSGKAADAKVVGDKLAQKELTLIETITVGENTQRIVRMATPDGVAFNLSAVYLNIKVPANSQVCGAYITLLNESTYVAYSPIDVFSNTLQTILNYWVDNYYGFAIPKWCYCDGQFEAELHSRVKSSPDMFLPITSVAIETKDNTINIPSGTIIEIYGVNN